MRNSRNAKDKEQFAHQQNTRRFAPGDLYPIDFFLLKGVMPPLHGYQTFIPRKFASPEGRITAIRRIYS